MTYFSTKTYGHEVGLSCCFRQWRARSHCRLLHGYALAVRLEFAAEQLDENGWVVDFGSLKEVKEWLATTFDHKLLVATDDPEYPRLMALGSAGLAAVEGVEATGCEAFAGMIYRFVDDWLRRVFYAPRVRLSSVTVSEHGANSACYTRRGGPDE